MKNLYFVLVTLLSLVSFAQNVNIPDANFKSYLVNNTDVNTNNDNQISVNEAASFTGTLAFQFYFINDLTGIEAFTNLTVLDCGDNNLTTIDLSQNTELTALYCYDNQLTSLDLSANYNLTSLDCRNNMLQSLNLDDNFALSYVQCTYNQLTSLDLSANFELNTVRCFANNLTSLVLPIGQYLTKVYCNNNDLTFLDLSLNQSLVVLNCDYNNLSTLYVENGNNQNVTTFSARGNSNLQCIQVDNENYSTTNWTNIDATTVFSENCTQLSVEEYNTIDLKLFPNPATTSINVSFKNDNLNYAILSMQGKIISTGNVNQANSAINVAHLTNGLYVIQLNDNSNNIVSKLFVKNNN